MIAAMQQTLQESFFCVNEFNQKAGVD